MTLAVPELESLPVRDEIEYPESDGKPIGETQIHILAMMYLLNALTYYFRNVPDVYVSSDMLMYYEEGNPVRFVVPDVFLVKGLDKKIRRTYKIWQERVPTVIFEVTSNGTRFDDLASKRGLYEMLGVREYFLFDPLDEYLKPRLQGFRLRGMSYEPLTPDAEGNLFSDEMQVWLTPDNTLLRVMDPQTKTIVPTFDEAMLERETESERAQAEAERAIRAEQELARVRAELDALRRKQGE
jgi:Uma2 family endonuclease